MRRDTLGQSPLRSGGSHESSREESTAMIERIRARLTYANVMATIAVFIALGGASYAALKLPKNSVGTRQLKKKAVTTAKIRREAVTRAKVRKGTLTGAQIKASTLGTVPNADRLDGRDGSDFA